MTKRSPKNIAASVRNRLYALSRERGDDFQLVLTHYAIERLLYRLSKSPHADAFVLKGAMLFAVWADKPYRPTRDLDLLGYGDNAPDAVAARIQDICRQPVEEDGVIFDEKSVSAALIREDQEYEGVRVTLNVAIDTARFQLQIDVGFGDAVVSADDALGYPTLLEFPAPHLRAYSRESVVAEKFQAMVSLGIANSRMKDFYDIWVLARIFDFDGSTLRNAIASTFERRQTALPADVPLCFSDEFVDDETKKRQWNAFCQRGNLKDQPESFGTVVALIREFIMPPTSAAASGRDWQHRWSAGGPWSGV